MWNRCKFSWLSAVAWLMIATSRSVKGFSNYLLSSSGCYVELDTDEVIMNHQVLPPQVDPPLRIEPLGLTPQPISSSSSSSSHVDPVLVLVPEFPTTVKIRVVATEHATQSFISYGYEYVLQIDQDSGSSFERGSCEGGKRIAGQSRDEVQLNLQDEGTVVWGAWAGNHEAVKLLQGFKFVSSLPEKEL